MNLVRFVTSFLKHVSPLLVNNDDKDKKTEKVGKKIDIYNEKKLGNQCRFFKSQFLPSFHFVQ